jgi:hypothetical protein
MISYNSVLVPANALSWLSAFGVDGPRFKTNLFFELGTIETLVLFDRIIVDSELLEQYRRYIPWLDELDPASFQVLTSEADAKVTLYDRSEEIMKEIFLSFSADEIRNVYQNPVPSKDETGALSILKNVSTIAYHLALQEKLDVLLLLSEFSAKFVQPHYQASKQVGSPPDNAASNATARHILAAFDEQVQLTRVDRQTRWLGAAPSVLPAPPLTRLVVSEADRRGWNLGRTVVWLRQQPEVKAFRQGVKELTSRVETGDTLGVDEILAELQAAADACSANIGMNPGRRGHFSLQASVPFLQPAVEIPIRLPARTPAQKMLALISWASRST